MVKRFISIWFRHLTTDWFTLRHPDLRELPFVVSAPSHGRMMIVAVNALAEQQGVYTGMVLADARATIPSLQVFDENPGLADKLLRRIAEWCIRFAPVVAVDLPGGIILDATGCPHLWGGDSYYLTAIAQRFKARGYDVRVGMADTIGCAWAIARFGQQSLLVESKKQFDALLPLSPAALRLEEETVELLNKLGLRQVGQFIRMPRPALRRRFGSNFLKRLDQALGNVEEMIELVVPVEPYQERLPCLEPIVTITGIEIALQRLLETLCQRLQQEEKGLRIARFKCYRVDGKIEQVDIGTIRPSHNIKHLFKLFEIKLSTIEPDLGIELFVLEAPKVEEHSPLQESLWNSACDLNNTGLSELLDRLAGKIGVHRIRRYLPAEHYWPERSVKLASSLDEKTTITWTVDKLRPLHLLTKPELIEVTAPIPDYPPMLFRYKNKLHKIIKADGPERIEQEWWLQQGQHRDYYYVEDEEGNRYWLFRLGHYSDKSYQWFIHGFFA
ncbi:MAG: DNA polymerase Y family protein [Chitinophagaceae bacterium]